MSYESILLWTGARTARSYLLLHGLSASPLQFETLARRLHETGANVFVPRLPRHGFGDRLSTELERLTAAELERFAYASVVRTLDLGAQTHVVGFSLGGLLAAIVGQRARIARITAIAPFLGIAGLPGSASRAAAEATLRSRNRYSWWNPVLRERLGPEHGYPRFSTHALAHATALARDLMDRASVEPPLARDLRIVVNASETAVSNREARRLAWLWKSTVGERARLYRLRGLGPTHDFIEPLRSAAVARRVYPPLFDLIAG